MLICVQPTLFEKGGITNPKTANLATGGVGIVLFVSSWIPIFFFDRLGRKTWLQIGIVGMMCAMIGITVLQWHAENNPGDRGNYAIVAFPYLFYRTQEPENTTQKAGADPFAQQSSLTYPGAPAPGPTPLRSSPSPCVRKVTPSAP